MSGADPLGLLGSGGGSGTGTAAPSGGGNSGDPLGLLGPGETRGPSNALAPSGPPVSVGAPHRGIFGQIAQAISGAPVGLIHFGEQAGEQFVAHPVEQLAHHLAHPSYYLDLTGKPESRGKEYQSYAGLGGPVTSGLLHSYAQTGEHLAAAATGHNPYGEASKQGQTIGSILGDFANLAVPLEAGGKIAEAASADAAATAAEHASLADAAAKATQDAYQAHAGLLRDMAPTDPAAAAQFTTTKANIAAREAEQQAAQATAETSAARAARLTQLARGLKTAAAAGNKAAGSPFAPFQIAGAHLLAPIAKEIFGHIADTGVGEKLSQALTDHQERIGIRHNLQEMRNDQARVEAPIVRAEQNRSTLLGGDETAKSAQILHGEGVTPMLAHAAATATPEARAALDEFLASRRGVTPEVAHTALDVATGAAPAQAARFDAATQLHAATTGAADQRRYLNEFGEITPNPGGADDRQWNVTSQQPRLQADQVRRMGRVESEMGRRQQKLAGARAQLEKLVAKNPQGPLPKDAGEFVRKVYEPLNLVAHTFVAHPEAWDRLVDDPTFGPVVRRLQRAKDPTALIPHFADALLRSLDAKPEQLSEAGGWMVRALRSQLPADLPEHGMARSVPRFADLAGVEKAATAHGQALAAQSRLDWAASLLGKSSDQMNAAEERLATQIADDPKIVSATNRLQQRAQKVERTARQVAEATAREGALSPYVVAQRTEKQMADDIVQVRQEIKTILRHQADVMEQELNEADALQIGRPPTELRPTQVRSGDLKGRDVLRPKSRNSGAWEGWENIPNWMRGNPRHVAEGGQTLEDALHNWQQFRAGARAGSQRGGEFGEFAPSAQEWVDYIEQIRDARTLANVDAKKGWDPARHAQLPVAQVAQVLGVPVERAQDYLLGTAKEAAAKVVGSFAQEVRAGRVMPGDEYVQPGDVHAALEQAVQGDKGPARALDTPGRAALATEGAKLGQLGALSGASEAQQRVVDLAQQGVEKARARGVREGTQLGAAQAGARTAEQVGSQAEGALGRAQEGAAKLPAARVEAVAKVAGRVGQRYYGEGERAQALREAARVVHINERSVERLGASFADRYAKEMNEVKAAPARYRVALETARQVRGDMENLANEVDKAVPGSGDPFRSVAAEIAVTLKDATDAGVNPPHYIGGPAPTPGAGGRASAQLPKQRLTGNRARKTGATPDAYEGDTRARLYKERVVRQVQNEYVKRIGATFGTTARAVLGDERMDEVLKGEGPKFNGAELLDALPGHSAWDPTSPFALPVRKAEQITPAMLDDTNGKAGITMMPDHILKEFGRTRNNADTNVLLRAYDRANQGIKTAWLGLSGRYLVGRLIGHTALASVGAGISPIELWSRMADAKRIFKQGAVPDESVLGRLSPKVRAGLDERAFAPPELANRGETAQMFPKEAFGREGENRLLHAVKWSRRFTNKIDNMANVGLYMGLLDRGLSPAGYEDFLAKYPEFKGLPRAQVEREAAVRLTLKVLGDFNDLSPLERNGLSRVVFFYPWMRHVTRLALDLAVHNPVRTAWVLHLGDMFNGQPDTGIPWLDPAFQLGHNNFLRYPSTFNPFETLTRLSPVGDSGLDPSGAFGSVSPVISAGFGLLGGADTSKGLQQISRPPGSGPLDQGTGATEAGPLINHPREALSYLGGLVPQVAALREAVPSLLGHQPVVRYPTGEAIHHQLADITPDQVTPGGRGLAKLVQLLGLPYEQNVNVTQIRQEARTRLARNQAQARTYKRGGHQGTPVLAAPAGGTAGADPLGILNGK